MITIQPLIFLFFATDYTNSHRLIITTPKAWIISDNHDIICEKESV
jgi:hypothetical protein